MAFIMYLTNSFLSYNIYDGYEVRLMCKCVKAPSITTRSILYYHPERSCQSGLDLGKSNPDLRLSYVQESLEIFHTLFYMTFYLACFPKISGI